VKAKPYFRIILRKDLNVNRIISDKIDEKDILEIGIRGIDVDSREYFIMIFLEPRFLDELNKKYELKEVRMKNI